MLYLLANKHRPANFGENFFLNLFLVVFNINTGTLLYMYVDEHFTESVFFHCTRYDTLFALKGNIRFFRERYTLWGKVYFLPSWRVFLMFTG